MKKGRRKRASETVSHNGVYRAEEIAKAFDIPRSVVYLWTVQEHLVTADYPGRSMRPSLFLEKSAATVLMISEMMKAGITKPEIKKFLSANRQIIYANKMKESEYAIIHKGYVSVLVRVGLLRSRAHDLLQEYANAIQEKPRTESRPVQAHHGEPVEDRPVNVASV